MILFVYCLFIPGHVPTVLWSFCQLFDVVTWEIGKHSSLIMIEIVFLSVYRNIHTTYQQ